MSHFVGLQSSIWSNRTKTFFLTLLFPVMIFVVLFIVVTISDRGLQSYLGREQFLRDNVIVSGEYFVYILPLIAVRFVLSFIFHRKIIFSFAGATPITRKEHPEIYNIVENLCISRGLRTPQIGIIEDGSMNAFATGRGTHSRIVFSRGLLNRLDQREIEAVAGHELTHITNKDTMLMVCVVVFIGIFATLGQVLLRVRVGGKKDSGKAQLVIFVAGLVCLLLGYIFFPLIKLAISRKREYLADAGSVELTKDSDAMVSALQKISTDAKIEKIKKETVASMCIENPFGRKEERSRRQNLRSTHPSVAQRIEMLKGYG